MFYLSRGSSARSGAVATRGTSVEDQDQAGTGKEARQEASTAAVPSTLPAVTSSGADNPWARAKMAVNLERIYTMFPRLRERVRQQAGTLSGGEQQMLAVARA